MNSDLKTNDIVRLKEDVSYELGPSMGYLYINKGTLGKVMATGNETMDSSYLEFLITGNMSIRLWVTNNKIELNI